MEVNVHHAKTHLSKLIAAAESGEEVIIARDGKPAVKLVLVGENKPTRRNLLGSGVGKLCIADDFHSPETSEEMADLLEGGSELE